jgi:hypothetical protein
MADLAATLARAAAARALAAEQGEPEEPQAADLEPEPAASRTPHADPRREKLREAFRHVTQHRADRAEQLRHLDTRLDEVLAADTAQTRDAPEILCTICDERGIDIDFAHLPDKYLRRDPAPEMASRIEPRANYPP